jgi:hypothetical protein
MMKRQELRGRPLAALLLLCLLSVLVVACGSQGSNDNAKDKKKEAKKEKENTPPPMASNTRFFADNSPWNTQIAGLPTDANSAHMIDLASTRVAVIEKPGEDGVKTVRRHVKDGLTINTEGFAPLIVDADSNGGVRTNFVCRQQDCPQGTPKVPDSLVIPPGTDPKPAFDGWLSVIDHKNRIGYDFWRARRETDDTISYQYAKAWTLGGPGFSNPVQQDANRAVGARGSGLPLFAGVIDPDAASHGTINHALAIAIPGLARRNYVQPASVTDGVGPESSLPAGARIRLRSNIDEDHILKGVKRRSAAAILSALRTYGAIVVDRSIVPTLYAPQGTSKKLINASDLNGIHLSDFEVMSLPKLYQDPPLSQVDIQGPAGSTTSQSGSSNGSSSSSDSGDGQ